MHMIFTDTELEWIDTSVFCWKIKDGCPEKIKKSIIAKKKKIDSQGVKYGKH